ncbi:MAG: hypothetical protein JXQ68_06025 [Campylobacterales bacterium]|nr:hypothetical protein [Campylobacterales bacterium]
MRKFFSIVIYVFAGIFVAGIVFGSFQDIAHDSDGMNTKLIVIAILTTISILFFALASWIYPSKNWQKPTAITLFIAVGLMLIGTLNNYFIMKDMQNLDLELAENKEMFQGEILAYNLPFGILVSLVFLAIAAFLYRKSLKV